MCSTIYYLVWITKDFSRRGGWLYRRRVDLGVKALATHSFGRFRFPVLFPRTEFAVSFQWTHQVPPLAWLCWVSIESWNVLIIAPGGKSVVTRIWFIWFECSSPCRTSTSTRGQMEERFRCWHRAVFSVWLAFLCTNLSNLLAGVSKG